MSRLLSQVTGFFDSVLGIEAAAARRDAESAGEVPCNMFSGFMIFGCRQRSR